MSVTQDQLDNAIATCDESIFRYIGESAVKDDISHKVIHIWTNLPEESNDNVILQAQDAEESNNNVNPLTDTPTSHC